MNIHINFISNILDKRMTYMSISYWVTEQPKHKVTGWHNLVVKRGELLAPTETWKVFKGIMEKEGSISEARVLPPHYGLEKKTL